MGLRRCQHSDSTFRSRHSFQISGCEYRSSNGTGTGSKVQALSVFVAKSKPRASFFSRGLLGLGIGITWYITLEFDEVRRRWRKSASQNQS